MYFIVVAVAAAVFIVVVAVVVCVDIVATVRIYHWTNAGHCAC